MNNAEKNSDPNGYRQLEYWNNMDQPQNITRPGHCQGVTTDLTIAICHACRPQPGLVDHNLATLVIH